MVKTKAIDPAWQEPDRVHRAVDLLSMVELHLLALHHNWDDGFAIPRAIVRSSHCDRGTALLLFWLSSPDEVLLRENLAHEERSEWLSFVGEARPKLFLHRFRKAGVPEILLMPSPGDEFVSTNL